jgi:cytochrome c oxidase cbb3-type subunit 3
VARRYQAQELLEKFLYPARGRERKPVQATVTLRSGETIAGEVEYLDDFIVSIRDAEGEHRSWPRESVQAGLKDPYAAHQDLLRKYSDADMHNLLAYLANLP